MSYIYGASRMGAPYIYIYIYIYDIGRLRVKGLNLKILMPAQKYIVRFCNGRTSL